MRVKLYRNLELWIIIPVFKIHVSVHTPANRGYVRASIIQEKHHTNHPAIAGGPWTLGNHSCESHVLKADFSEYADARKLLNCVADSVVAWVIWSRLKWFRLCIKTLLFLHKLWQIVPECFRNVQPVMLKRKDKEWRAYAAPEGESINPKSLVNGSFSSSEKVQLKLQVRRVSSTSNPWPCNVSTLTKGLMRYSASVGSTG